MDKLLARFDFVISPATPISAFPVGPEESVEHTYVLKEISDDDFPDADLITLLHDNLNIPAKASLDQAFPAPEARRLVQRFEWGVHPQAWLVARSGGVRTGGPLRANASIAAFQINTPSNARSPPGSNTATSITQRPTGASQPRPLGSNSSAYTPCFR